MYVVRVPPVLAVVACASLLVGGIRAQKPRVELDPGLPPLIEAALDEPITTSVVNRLWQAAAAAQGSATPLIDELRRKLGAGEKAARAARLLIGVLRYEGLPRQAIDVDRRIDPGQRTVEDDLTLAEVYDTVGERRLALAAYDALVARELTPALRHTVLLRRALLQDRAAEALEQFARAPERTTEERNQAAILLGLFDRPAAAVDLLEIRGEPDARFRDLVRAAEWATASGDHARAQQFAWDAAALAAVRRDQRYALTLAVSAFRAGNAIDALLRRFEESEGLSEDGQQIWLDVLRDERRFDDALRLLRSGGERRWTAPQRRQLLEITRDSGDRVLLVSTFRELIAAEPDNLEWCGGLCRHYLEHADRAAAEAVWQEFVARKPTPRLLLQAARGIADLGLADLALTVAERAAEDPTLRQPAWLFVVDVQFRRGAFEEAIAALQRIEAHADAADAVLAKVAEFYRRLGRPEEAVAALARLRGARQDDLGNDLEGEYALLLSKVDRDADAFGVWRGLWERTRGTPHGRYVEDRMMTVASRLGVLADLAIELEDRLESGAVTMVDVELLVRLYIKVGDAAAATEVAESFLPKIGVQDVEILRRKANIYLACEDYVEYERMVEQLVERDEEKRLDHQRELLLCRLERGRRDLAIEQLPAIRADSDGEESADEFEAGVLQLAGLKDRALTSFVKSVGRHPDRIDTHLLIGALMRDIGDDMQSVRRFQYLASTADEDDLFTIAIDGLLNQAAVASLADEVADWALRVTLERLAAFPDRFYLHRLAADLAEERKDLPQAIRILVAGLPIAGERRTPLLRELLQMLRLLDKEGMRPRWDDGLTMRIGDDWDPTQYVALGRRLLGQGEIVPPEVYMDLATVFLKVGAVADAMTTFSRAAELLEPSDVYRQAADILEDSEHFAAALTLRRRLLATSVDDVDLMVRVGLLEEQIGDDRSAAETYRRGLEVAWQHTQTRVQAGQKPDASAAQARGSGRRLGPDAERNVDSLARALPRLVRGLLVTLDTEAAGAFAANLRDRLLADLHATGGDATADERIEAFPRLKTQADTLRRVALAFRCLAYADAADHALLQRFPADASLADEVVRFRTERGFRRSALAVLSGSPLASDPRFGWLAGNLDFANKLLPPEAVAARIMPLLIDDPARLRDLLERVDPGAFGFGRLGDVPTLVGACAVVGARDATDQLGRAVVRAVSQVDSESFAWDLTQQVRRVAGRIDPRLRQELLDAEVYALERAGEDARTRFCWTLSDTETIDPAVAERWLRDFVQTQSNFYPAALLRSVPAGRVPELIQSRLDNAEAGTAQAWLLISSLPYLEDPLSPTFVERLCAAARTAPRRMQAWLGQSLLVSPSESLRRAALQSIDLDGAESVLLLAAIRAQLRLENRPAAVAVLHDHIAEILTPTELLRSSGANQVGFDAEHIENIVWFLKANGLVAEGLRAVEAGLLDRPSHEGMRLLRWLSTRELPDAAYRLAEALRDHPEDRFLREVSYRFQAERGHLAEAVELIEPLVVGAEAERWRAERAELERKLHNFAASTSESGRPTPGQSATRPMPSDEDADDVSPVVAAILSCDDPVAARGRFRQVWRRLSSGPWATEDVLPTVSTATLDALRGTSFLPDEVERILRVWEEAGSFDATVEEAVCSMLAISSRSEGTEATLEALVAEVEAGRSGKLELWRCLQLSLDESIDAQRRQTTIARLAAHVERPTGVDLRLMARALARDGRFDAAFSLYRCLALATSWSSGGVERLLAEVESVSPGDRVGTALVTLADDLAAREPLDVNVNLAVMEVWRRFLPTADAIGMVLASKQRLEASNPFVTTFGMEGDDPRAKVEAVLARLFVAAGDLGAAAESWSQVVTWSQPELRSSRSRSAMRSAAARSRLQVEPMLAVIAAGGERRAEWLRELARSTLELHQQGRLIDPAQTIGAVAAALAELEAPDYAAAQPLIAALRRGGVVDARWLLQVTKVERAFLHEKEALSLEAQLLAARRLPIEDHARVVRAIAQLDGVETALRSGEKALAYTPHAELLTAMIDLAESAGQVERAAPWRELLAAEEARAAERTR